MKIQEITKLSQRDFPGGKDELQYNRKDLQGLKPLPGGSGFQYNVVDGNRNPTIQIWDPEGPDAEPNSPQLIGELATFSMEKTFPIKDALTVASINCYED